MIFKKRKQTHKLKRILSWRRRVCEEGRASAGSGEGTCDLRCRWQRLPGAGCRLSSGPGTPALGRTACSLAGLSAPQSRWPCPVSSLPRKLPVEVIRCVRRHKFMVMEDVALSSMKIGLPEVSLLLTNGGRRPLGKAAAISVRTEKWASWPA